jgi:hypothetical protein
MSSGLPKVNTHIHLPPNFSAFSTVDEALDQAASEGVEILGASNYYDFSIYKPFAEAALAQGIEPLFGIEIVCRIASLAEQGIKINDPGNPGKMYICGKALTRFQNPTPRAQALLDTIRSGDEARISRMVELLTSVFQESGIDASLDSRSIVFSVAEKFGVPESTVVLQERHVAQAFQEALFDRVDVAERADRMAKLFKTPSKADPSDSVAIQAEIRTHLMKAGRSAFVEENFVTFEEAKELITELGGIVCYPVLADGMNPISEFEADPINLAHRLMDLGISSAEFIPNRNKAEVLSNYVGVLEAMHFALSAGTEHNTTEKIAVVPQCKGGEPIPDLVQQLFVHGALRQVKHQKAILV